MSATLPSEAAHVPANLVFDFDVFSDARLKDDIHNGLLGLLDEAPPIFYTPRNQGHWVFMKHADVMAAMRDTGTFSSNPHVKYPDYPSERMAPIQLDPPDMNPYRRLLVDAFSTSSINGFAGDVVKLTDALIDRLIDRGHCDFVREMAEILPVQIFMRYVGLPLDRADEFRSWVLAGVAEYTPEGMKIYWDKIREAAADIVAERRANPQDDLISRMLESSINDEHPTDEQMLNILLLLFIAGLDTVVNAMSFAIHHLAGDPEAQDQLRANPALIPAFVEETLRRYTPTIVSRYVTKDTEFRGIKLKKQDTVVFVLALPNLDKDVFPDPAEIKLDRKGGQLAFNSGAHFCVGVHLARLEMRILLERWLARFPRFSRDPDKLWAHHPAFVFSVDSLPLIWDPASARAE